MSEENINARLVEAKEKAQLSTADMTTWFGVNKGTMNLWLSKGSKPLNYRLPQIEAKLLLLETAIKHDVYFPIPLEVTQFKRAKHLLKIRDDIAARVSEVSSSA